MSSTGEVACLGDDFNEAFLKSVLSIGFRIPEKGILLSTGPLPTKTVFLEEMKMLQSFGLEFYGTQGTVDFYAKYGFEITPLNRPYTKQEPNILTYMENGKIDLVINIPKSNEKDELDSDYFIRRKAIDLNIPLITNIQVAKRFVRAVYYNEDHLHVKSWEEYN
jgi:carbamoyl-phosphate synthase large subunit